MSIHGYVGNIITANPTAPTVTSASGVWTTEQQLAAVSAGNWPGYEYPISRSLRFNSGDLAYLNRTPGSAGNRRIFTFSAWIKRSQANALVGIMGAGVNADSTQTDLLGFDGTNGNSLLANFGDGTYFVTTVAVLRDFSAWYHVVFAIDTTQATNTNRVKIYLNGIQQTLSGTYPPQNYDSAFNTTNFHTIGSRSRSGAASNYLNGYLTEVNFIDGQALEPSSFGLNDPETGVWSPKRYTGTYGTNGFYLNFSDNSNNTAATLGKDYSGNGNNWTPNNFVVSPTTSVNNDSMVDSPTAYGTDTGVGGEVRGNYCTLNPIDKDSSTVTLTNGNLSWASGAPTYNQVCRATIAVTSGKWYWEVTPLTTGAWVCVGVADAGGSLLNASRLSAGGWYYSGVAGNKLNNGANTAYGATFTNNDVIGAALDMDTGSLTFYKNGASQGVAYSTGLAGKSIAPSLQDQANDVTAAINFGQRPFAYTPPTGFKALNTQNLPEPVIAQGNKHFDVALVTGNSSVPQVITTSFAPDFLWSKCRSAAVDHGLYDTVRGGNRILSSNTTGAEVTTTSNIVTFTSTGASLQAGGSIISDDGRTYVDWLWKANGAGVSNTDGSITSTVSANTTAGFSIVTYTGNGTGGATVGYGLGVAPKMIIIKSRSFAGTDWPVYHASVGNTAYLQMNTTSASITTSGAWNNTSPTSSVFSLGTGGSFNSNGQTYVAYCFSEVAGFSKLGSYQGNGSSDGPFVYTGFRPKYVLIRDTGAADWDIQDTARSPFNTSKERLWANLSSAEVVSTYDIDFLSNGFKIRSTNPDTNSNGGTKIFAAFAENPFKNALAR
jgi:hypothetical protein